MRFVQQTAATTETMPEEATRIVMGPATALQRLLQIHLLTSVSSVDKEHDGYRPTTTCHVACTIRLFFYIIIAQRKKARSEQRQMISIAIHF
jgi:hypothetical protein